MMDWLVLMLVALGLVMVVVGADFLVDGASAIARKAGVSEFVIGLTIVGFGTSCPELVVSLTGAVQANADISVGNVIGSNIFNTLLILGLSALLHPITITAENRRRDIPVTAGVTLILLVAGMGKLLFNPESSDGISRVEGIVFVILFAAYIYTCFKYDSATSTADDEESVKEYGVFAMVALVLVGLAGLIFGGRLFVDNSVILAKSLGVSDKFIAITLLAGGTSLPELVTSIVALAKGKSQLALGNILGSNVFNILFILGLASVVTPLSFSNISPVDMVVLVSSILLVLFSAYTGNKNRIDRWEGAVMLAAFLAYYVYLFIHA